MAVEADRTIMAAGRMAVVHRTKANAYTNADNPNTKSFSAARQSRNQKQHPPRRHGDTETHGDTERKREKTKSKK